MKKRIVAIGLACLTAGAGLSGCAGNDTQQETTVTAEETTVTTAAETTTVTETTEAPTTTTTEAPATTAKSDPEDEKILEQLKAFYDSHEKINGVPAENGKDTYSKFAIADFDADGKKEIMVEYNYYPEIGGESQDSLIMYEADEFSRDSYSAVAPYTDFSKITFLDNGVAYEVNENAELRFDDNKTYYLFSREWLAKLNYNMDYAHHQSKYFILDYYKNDGKIMKSLHSANDAIFDPKEKTQAEYDNEKQMLNSGKVMDIDVKDFTAENLGIDN